jgi:protein-tyrosine phosphatase
VALTEIVRGTVYQSDGDSRIAERLHNESLIPALVIDLHGISFATDVLEPRIAFVRWPIEDGPVPDRQLLHALELAATSFAAGGGVVVTMCNMGLNRSGLLSALIVSRLHRISCKEAAQFVRSKRPGALANPVFAHYLEVER